MAKKKSPVEDIMGSIEGMTVLELAELVGALKEKFGVSAMPVAATAPAAANGAEAEEEQTEFNVNLAEVGPNKIPVIKVVRQITGLGLKEAKAVVDEAPGPVKEGVSKDEADEIVAKLEAEGAKAEIK
ncbi:MAG: 50S ribosomal protein L7/L12 [Chloroflexota bacterium]|jgi:large subunit ribosomal protein L7/L12|nr:50S ribosomal protein L7/L12 [Chloroflexota bacterium]MDP6757289.1 50S ribosomal protein L7/L12 [Chloroflexota bacterium]